MDFLNPAALWLLPLAGVPLLLVRRRPELGRLAVSSVQLWRAADPLEPAQPSVRRVRRDWLAIIQALFLLAIVVALARPSIAGLVPRAAFILDVSASMGTRQDQVTRLDLARQQALQALAGLPSRTRVRLIAAAASARDLGEFPAHSAELRRALDGLRPLAGRANMADAFDLARAGDAALSLWVFSDAPSPTADQAPTVRWTTVGEPAGNVAVTALSARRVAAAPRDAQVVIELFNAGTGERDISFDLHADGRPIAREELHLNPHEARTLVRAVRNAEAIVEARITSAGDPLDVDNQRVILVPPVGALRVRLVTAGNFFLEKALAANPSLQVTVADPRDTAPAPEADVIVCDGCAEIPPGAAGVLLVPMPPAEPMAPAPLTIGTPGHPLARALDAAAAVAAPTAAWPLEDALVVLRAGGAPLLVARDRAGRRVAALNLDLRSSAFPLTTVFPVLVANTLDWLSARGENARDITAGDPLQWRLAGSGLTPPLSVLGPDGRSRPFQIVNGRLIVTGTDVPGIYTVTGQTRSERFAVNPATDTETDSSRSATRESAAAPPGDEVVGRRTVEVTIALLVVALGLLAAEWRLTAPSARRTQRFRRLALVCILLLAAAGVRVPTGQGRMDVMFALDRSESVSLRAQRAAESYVTASVRDMRNGDMAGVVVFGSEATIDRRPSPRTSGAGVVAEVPAGGTNIEAALRLARRALPPDGPRRVVLISDGRQTAGDAEREAAIAAADGVRVDVLPLDRGPLVVPAIRGVRAPEEVRAGEPFVVSAVVEGPPGSRARISILPDDQPRITRDVDISPDGTASVQSPQRRLDPGTYIFRAALEDPDFLDPPVGAAVTVTGRPSVLYISTGDPGLSPVFEASGFRVVPGGPGAVPTTDAGLAAFDAVVLDDVPAEAWTAAQTGALARYVEQTGGGLLLLGSATSLESSGYQEGSLGALLPIDLRVRPGRRSPAAAFVVVFDKSGSMADRAAGIQKIELARQAILRVLNVLPLTDSLGVIAFDSQAVVVAPLGPTQDSREIAAALRRIEPAGATAIAPALELAARWLRDAPVERRHILLVSDGRTTPADMDRVGAVVRGGGFELSVVAIGADADRAAFGRLAEATGGHAYFPDDIRQLPTIAARDAVQSRGGATVDERFTVRAPAAHPVLTGFDRGALPLMNGYVVSAVKGGAEAILVSHLDDPVLAAWRVGLGRVGVFTGDLRSEWSAVLRRWSGFGALWGQTLRWVSRRSADGLLRAELTETDDGVSVAVDLERADGSIPDLGDVRARLRSPAGDVQDVRLKPIAPGRLETRVAAQQSGTYQLSVSAIDLGSGGEVRLARVFHWSSQRERLGGDPDRAFLTRLAEMTGGRVLASHDNPFTEPRPLEYRSARAALLLAAVAFFLAHLVMGRGGHMSGIRRWWRERRTPMSPTHEAAA